MDKVGLALDPKGDIKVESDLAIKVLDPSGDDLDSEPTLEKKKTRIRPSKKPDPDPTLEKTRVRIRATRIIEPKLFSSNEI